MTGTTVTGAVVTGTAALPRPRYCVWELTLACDLGCRHCGSRAGSARPDELDTRECLDVVAQLHEAGVSEVTLIGGEAYLRDDWDVIARSIVDHGMRCTMTTGARQLGPDRIARAVAAGMAGVTISIDGLEQTHDALRGARGSWRAATEAARAVRAAGLTLGVNTQINRLSLPELPALATLLVELGAVAWQVQLTVPMGRAADRPALLLQPWELLELFPLLAWIRASRLEPAGCRIMLGNNLGYHGPWESLLRFGGAGTWQGCSAGDQAIGLEADGAIKGCPSLATRSWTGGNLRRDRLVDVIAAAPELRRLRERTRADLHGWCAACEHADACRGGCSWTADVYFGRPGDNPFCVHRALAFEARGLRERVVRVQSAPGLPFDHGLFEIVVEPIPDAGESPVTALLDRYPLGEVLALTPRDASLADSSTRRDTLRAAPRLAPGAKQGT